MPISLRQSFGPCLPPGSNSHKAPLDGKSRRLSEDLELPTGVGAPRVPRKGTSIQEFLDLYPDSEACLRHVFETRFGKDPPCPDCGDPTSWYQIRTTKEFVSICCSRNSLHPLSGTIFSKTAIPLQKWFYAMLHFCNSSSGLTPRFVAEHLGISVKAATRMSDRIRHHLLLIDAGIGIGGPGRRVYIYETKLRGVHHREARQRNDLRILALSDDANFTILAIKRGRFAASVPELLSAVVPGSILEFQDEETLRKVCSHKQRSHLGGMRLELATNRYDPVYCEMSVMLIAMKQFLMKSHLWIGEGSFDRYVAHFAFLYRRRHAGDRIFHDALAGFPRFAAAG